MESVWDSQREYCLNCVHKPCSTKGCPLGNDIPSFIHEEDAKKAFEILSETTVLPAICGRVCPHSKQCKGSCVRGISGEPVRIGEVESYIGDISLREGYEIPKANEAFDTEAHCDCFSDDFYEDEKVKTTGKKVAVIGSGPCGLTCAAFLARYGANVTIYEKYDKLGGLLIHGIPDFRLDRKIVEQTTQKILALGINVETNKELGKDIFIEELAKKYDAVFVSVGANLSNETLKGAHVIKGNEFLENLNLLQEEMGLTTEELSKQVKENNIEATNQDENSNAKVAVVALEDISHCTKIVVSGGGNVAMDCARTFTKLGANVTVVYRRDREQMPAEDYEIEMAEKEGVKFLLKTNIKNFDAEKRELDCIQTELVKVDGDDRLSPRNLEGSDFKLAADYVVLATGSHSDKELLENEHLELDEKGYIKTNEKYQTSIKNVFAGGDVAGEKQTVAWAAKAGREAAKAIITEMS